MFLEQATLQTILDRMIFQAKTCWRKIFQIFITGLRQRVTTDFPPEHNQSLKRPLIGRGGRVSILGRSGVKGIKMKCESFRQWRKGVATIDAN
ncbi:hypothetical protein TNCV_1987581 [Trichonephila clavipes]|nr:hypothetical protein TNCV_1987581 [Trichonephila clavipes]